MDFLKNPAMWASTAALLTAVGIPLHGISESVALIVAGACGLIGIGESIWNAGHHIKYEGPPK